MAGSIRDISISGLRNAHALEADQLIFRQLERLAHDPEMSRWIDRHLSPTVQRYLEREVQGQTAGR